MQLNIQAICVYTYTHLYVDTAYIYTHTLYIYAYTLHINGWIWWSRTLITEKNVNSRKIFRAFQRRHDLKGKGNNSYN